MVEIIRARIPRQVLAVLASDHRKWSEMFQKLPQDVYISLEKSMPLDTRQDDDLLKLLSAMEAMGRRYDGFEPLFAQRRPLQIQTLLPDDSPKRGRELTRRGETPPPKKASATKRSMASDESRDSSTESSLASSPERTMTSTQRRGLSQGTGSPLRRSEQVDRPERSGKSQHGGPTLYSASLAHPIPPPEPQNKQGKK